ncbi:MAG: hypothetical protein JWM56_63 [Candidatus Peribacteria bacterium]|nr:hypothetical protein [Candidatus Peribacteria bacterium]
MDRQLHRIPGPEITNYYNGGQPGRLLHSDSINSMLEQFKAIFQDAVAKQKAEIARWKEWLPCISDATEIDIPTMAALYQQTIVSNKKLNDLIRGNEEQQYRARINLENEGGFLHEEAPDMNLEQYVHQGICRVLKSPAEGVLGFYTILTDHKAVQETSMREFGWQPGKKYESITDLPQVNTAGDKLMWIKPEYACNVLNKIEENRLALPGSIVIKRNDINNLPTRDLGLATALKVQAYESLPEDCYTLTSIFHIRRVKTENVDMIFESSVVNRWSEIMNRRLGAEAIGYRIEKFIRADGIELEVYWELNSSKVKDLVRRAYERKT